MGIGEAATQDEAVADIATVIMTASLLSI